MTDDQKKVSPDDEYQFPQDEYASADSGSESQTESDESGSAETVEKKTGFPGFLSHFSALPIFKNKRAWIVIAAVILIIIFIRVLDTGKKTQPISQQSVVSQQQAPVTIQQPDNAVLGSLDALKAHSSRTEAQINELHSQVTSLQNTVSETQSENQQLQQKLVALESQISGISETLQRVITKMPKGKRLVYHLRAVLPDRAWVTSGNGETLTVTVGDRVPEYGVVSSINAEQGIIETSSGRKIQYGPNDY